MSLPDPIKQLIAELHRLDEMVQRQDYDEAIALLRRAKTVAHRAGATSAWVEWQLCVVLDMKGESLEALSHVREALRLDPVVPHNHSSRDVILRRLRVALCAEDRDVKEPEVALIYRALVREDAADSWCHLASARHHLACDRPAVAQRILDAVEILAPDFAPALLLKANMLTTAGRAEEADEVRSRALALAAVNEEPPTEATQPAASS